MLASFVQVTGLGRYVFGNSAPPVPKFTPVAQ
jgi:hypothetical protein